MVYLEPYSDSFAPAKCISQALRVRQDGGGSCSFLIFLSVRLDLSYTQLSKRSSVNATFFRSRGFLFKLLIDAFLSFVFDSAAQGPACPTW